MGIDARAAAEFLLGSLGVYFGARSIYSGCKELNRAIRKAAIENYAERHDLSPEFVAGIPIKEVYKDNRRNFIKTMTFRKLNDYFWFSDF